MPRALDLYGWERSMVVLAVMAGSCALVAILFKPLNATEVEFVDEEAAEETREFRSSRHGINAAAAIMKNQNGSTPSLDTKDVSFEFEHELREAGSDRPVADLETFDVLGR